jgi:hypothetical protein
MKLDAIYPFWSATHEEFVDRLRYITDAQWDAMPAGPACGSIRLFAYRFLQFERMWMQKIAQERPLEPLHTSDLQGRMEYISELEAVRATTIAYLESLPVEALRSVRVAPGDPVRNEIERNVPLSWIVWRVLEEELMTYGQVRWMADLTTPPRQSMSGRS